MTKEQLMFETDVLATDYFISVYSNDGTQIVKVFREYCQLMKDEDVWDKRVVENAMTIMSIYDRESGAIEKEVRTQASKMRAELENMFNTGQNRYILEMDEDINFKYEDEDSVREWILTH